MGSIYYLITGTCALSTCYYFLCTKDGALRKLLIFFYGALAWYQFCWAYYICMYMDIIEMYSPIKLYAALWYMANMPFMVALFILTLYIWTNGRASS